MARTGAGHPQSQPHVEVAFGCLHSLCLQPPGAWVDSTSLLGASGCEGGCGVCLVQPDAATVCEGSCSARVLAIRNVTAAVQHLSAPNSLPRSAGEVYIL